MNRKAFDFLDIDERPGKPRRSGLTAVRDRMRSLDEQRTFLTTYAPFVDFAKISNLSPRLYPEAFLREKLALYIEYNVTPFFGGILFENAVAQGKADQLATYLRALSAPAVEISNNILDLSTKEMVRHVQNYSKAGITVFVEWGEKYPTGPMDPDAASDEIGLWLEAGASFVILERSEIDQLLRPELIDRGITILQRLSQRLGSQRVIFEAETQEQCVSLLRGLGRDVNLGPNIDFEMIKWLEPSRLGISREMGHTTIEAAAGHKAVRSRLEG